MNSLTHTDAKPWYRYPLVWMLISIPASAVAICSVIIWLAVTTTDGLVVDDYYAQGMAINKSLDRDRHAYQHHVAAKLNIMVTEGLINLDLDKGLLANYPDTLQLILRHATRADSDFTLELLHGQGSRYIGYLNKSLPAGAWYIELGNPDWRLNARSRVENMASVKLSPLPTDN